MGICTWLVFGGLAGWIASLIAGTNQRMGLIANVFTGILGAGVGGWLFHRFGGVGVTGFNLYSGFVAVTGAVICLTVMKLILK